MTGITARGSGTEEIRYIHHDLTINLYVLLVAKSFQ